MVYNFVKKNNLIISINKVKSHSKNFGNDIADNNAKWVYYNHKIFINDRSHDQWSNGRHVKYI